MPADVAADIAAETAEAFRASDNDGSEICCAFSNSFFSFSLIFLFRFYYILLRTLHGRLRFSQPYLLEHHHILIYLAERLH